MRMRRILFPVGTLMLGATILGYSKDGRLISEVTKEVERVTIQITNEKSSNVIQPYDQPLFADQVIGRPSARKTGLYTVKGKFGEPARKRNSKIMQLRQRLPQKADYQLAAE